MATLNHLRTTSKEYSWGNIAFPHALYNPSTQKFYLATAKKSDGKVYIVEIDKNGNVRELQLQMPTYPDSTYGDGDCHIVPAIIWLDDSKTKIVAVGGDHVGGSFHIEIIDVVNWQSEKVIDSGIYGSYHILIRKSTGEIIIFYRNNSNGHLYYVKYNPSNDSVSSPVQVTTASSGESAKGISMGYDYDTNRYIIVVTPDWTMYYYIWFDAETEKFYDIDGNELTLPVDPTTQYHPSRKVGAPVKYGNYIYAQFVGDIDNDDNNELAYCKFDTSGNEVKYVVLADDIDTTNYWGGDYSVCQPDPQHIFIITPTVVKYAEIDENLSVTDIISTTPDTAPLRAKLIFIDMYANNYELYNALATGEDYHDQSNEILQASNPQYLNIYYVEELKPEFKITNYPTTVSGSPNESKTISITVENQGNADGDCTVRIKDHNGNVVAEQTKTITAGGSATYSLQITLPSTTGTYTWTIEAYNVTNDTVDDTKTFTVNVVQQVPLFAITSYPTTVSGTPSETKIISITVENLGNADGDCTVRIKDHNGNVVASDTKAISVGGSATYSLSIALPSETGTYTWTIEAYNVSTDRVDDTVTFTVEVEELRPEFKITNYPTTVSGSPNESKTISITVENQGNVEGTVEARIKDHNDNLVASQQQTISAGQSYTFSLQITLPSNTGTYTWTIEAYNVDTNAVDDTKSFTVEVTTAPTKKKEFPWWILLLLLGMGYVSSRGYKEEHEE